jgi:hypothetical protein
MSLSTKTTFLHCIWCTVQESGFPGASSRLNPPAFGKSTRHPKKETGWTAATAICPFRQ